MAKKVIISPLASINYENIINYLLINWDRKVTDQFAERFQAIIRQLSEDPDIYQFTDRKRKTQKCVLTKHNTLYFRQIKHIVEVITIFDTRQAPRKLRTILK